MLFLINAEFAYNYSINVMTKKILFKMMLCFQLIFDRNIAYDI